MAKAAFVFGAAVGYVLGARAGRKRYEQIKGQAARVWQSDPVQHRVGDATQAVKQQAAPFVTEKLGDAMKAVSHQMRTSSGPSGPSGQSGPSKSSTPSMPSTPSTPGRTEKLPETVHRDADGKLHADMTGMAPEGKLP